MILCQFQTSLKLFLFKTDEISLEKNMVKYWGFEQVIKKEKIESQQQHGWSMKFYVKLSVGLLCRFVVMREIRHSHSWVIWALRWFRALPALIPGPCVWNRPHPLPVPAAARWPAGEARAEV